MYDCYLYAFMQYGNAFSCAAYARGMPPPTHQHFSAFDYTSYSTHPLTVDLLNILAVSLAGSLGLQ